MSKYNNIKSIPIESIPKEEIKIAIHEWAEGDDSMEKLLWACYEKGIKTGGCHAGARPYIDFKYQENLNRIIPLFDTTIKVVGSQILIMVDGGNPFSGPEWYIPSIGIGIDAEYKDEADIYFDDLTKSLEKGSNNTHPLLELLEFFLDKESGLLFRLRHNKDDKYVFHIESTEINEDRYKYYNNVFTKAGLIENKNAFPIELENRHDWKIEDDKQEDILKKIDKAKDIIVKEYDLKPETNEDRIISFILKTRLKKNTLSEEEFNKWLEEKREILFK